MRKYKLVAVAAFALLVLSVQAEVTVSNLVVAQRPGTKLVDIGYDMSGTTTNIVRVSLVVSNGASEVSAVSLTGDVGFDVPVSEDKSIVWDGGADWDGSFSSNMVFMVRVDDEFPLGMVLIHGGNNSGTNPLAAGESYNSYYPENYSLSVSTFYMDIYEVTNDEMVRVMQWAYDSGKLVVSSTSVKNAEGNQQELLDLDNSYCRITWSGTVFGMKSLKGSGYPCVEVTWYGSAAYCNYRSEIDGRTPCYNLTEWSCDFTANGYRLSTNDEWEYAARGGLSGKRFPWGDTINHDNANYSANGSVYSYDTSPYTNYTYHPDYDDNGWPYTSPVGTFAANGYGLYNMAGNVWEWCNDASGSDRYIRGGGWRGGACYLRCGYLYWNNPHGSPGNVGFRAVRR